MQNIQSEQLSFLPPSLSVCKKTKRENANSGSFINNMSLPIHRWFRYSAGFSAKWAASLIESKRNQKDYLVLDPFAGSGTTLLAADEIGVKSIGYENHSFIHRIAKAKLNWTLDEQLFLSLIDKTIKNSKIKKKPNSKLPLILKCYTVEQLIRLEALKNSYLELKDDGVQEWNLVWLTITSILRKCSQAGTAQWQYVLPNKKKAKVIEPFTALSEMATIIATDIQMVKHLGYKKQSNIILTDARSGHSSSRKKVDLVLTSPPYPNNYDYADSTRLEMMFWDEITGWGELQSVVRKNLIRSCSQHSAAEKLQLDDILSDNDLLPIRSDLEKTCNKLAEIRKTKGGKKTYHTMVAAYFLDLSKVWKDLRKKCKTQSDICFVIGDSAPYGIYVPVDIWLTKLAENAGFTFEKFEKLRDRNIKWKNRKHRVPLKEGRLWLKG